MEENFDKSCTDLVILKYCGKYYGTENLPGSDGYCGPHDGPQCHNCLLNSKNRIRTNDQTEHD